ncbi:hypothetical protein MANES_16G033751v8 [Manihot esculenta]|uniref:Uncharacterized protein n=1 Tax=Manihot esculenta TaxID=3983 RepID=A0ACB7G5C6_MANES|nr:hypothetical protein MANES_16G033751v8 [Manihot esculenta]
MKSIWNMDTNEKIVIGQRFSYPSSQATDDWILKSLNKKWRDYKGDLKQENYGLSKTKDEIIENAPEGVMEDQWATLVNSWFTEKSQKLSEINKANAKKKKNAHTCGRKSFARKKFEMEKARALISERSQDASIDSSELNEQVFQEVMGEEHNGRVSGVGFGPTPTSYYGRKRARNESSDFVQSKKIEFLEKQLEEVTKNYDTVTTTLNGLKAWISKTFPGALEEINEEAINQDHCSPNNISSHSSHNPGHNPGDDI